MVRELKVLRTSTTATNVRFVPILTYASQLAMLPERIQLHQRTVRALYRAPMNTFAHAVFSVARHWDAHPEKLVVFPTKYSNKHLSERYEQLSFLT